MAVKPKRTEYAVALDRAGRVAAEGCPPLDLSDEWTAEHLVLAGLARCSIAALAYHARRAGAAAAAHAEASGAVTRRQDGSWGFVDIECRIEAAVDPPPDDPAELAASAERGCFVGASLRPKPTYRWRINGTDVLATVA